METFDLSIATGASKSASRPRLKSSEQWIWLNAAAIGASLCALFGMLLLLFVKGLAHFWPADIAQIDYTNTFGESVMKTRMNISGGLRPATASKA